MSKPAVVQLAEKLKDAYNNFEADHPQTSDLFTDDIFYRDPRFPAFVGKEALRGYLRQVAGENRTLQVKWDYVNIISQGDWAAVEWRVSSGLDFGGKKLEFPGAAFFKARNDRICYYQGYWDTAVIQQLSE